MNDLNLALIGNSTIAALIDNRADIVWSCMPRLDSDPVFDALLREPDGDAAGRFTIELLDYSHSEQHYEKNTAILVTRLHARDGSAVEIVDFAPRFKQYGRIFRPVMLVRQIRPCAGTPRIRIRLRPQASRLQSPTAATMFAMSAPGWRCA